MTFNESLVQLNEDDFQFLLKNGKRSSVLNDIDFESLCYSSYRFIKDTAPDLIKAGNFEKLIKIFEIISAGPAVLLSVWPHYG